jgi:DNA-binding CsgD family transcriptional regulator
MKKHIITEKEYEAVKRLARENKLKRIDRRLQVILLRYEGKKDEEIAEKLDYTRKREPVMR